MSDSTFDLSFDSELDEFDPLEDTGADDDENEGGDYTAISSATDAPAQQLEAESDNRTPAERIDDLFKSMAPRRKVLLGILSFVQEPQTAEALRKGDEEEAAALLTTQKNFLEDHLLSWVPMMTADMKRFAKTDLYQGLAYLTDGFLNTDKAFLDDVLTEDE